MTLESVIQKGATLTLSQEEIRHLHQALNEICNGVDLEDEEFSTRLGASREELLALMGELGSVYRQITKEQNGV